MATAIATLNIDELRKELETLDQQILGINQKGDGYSKQLTAAESEVTSTQAAYEEACRRVAIGKDADAVGAQAALDRLGHKIRGLRSLIEETLRPVSQLHQRRQEIVVRIEGITEAESEQVLIAKRDNTWRGVETARAALSEAELANRRAVAELDTFRNQIEHKRLRRQRGQE